MICTDGLPAVRISVRKKIRITGVSRIAGIDEAGRGALAGPVVAAAAILPEKFRHRRLNDSKARVGITRRNLLRADFEFRNQMDRRCCRLY